MMSAHCGVLAKQTPGFHRAGSSENNISHDAALFRLSRLCCANFAGGKSARVLCGGVVIGANEQMQWLNHHAGRKIQIRRSCWRLQRIITPSLAGAAPAAECADCGTA